MSQSNSQIQFCYVTRQYPDTVLLRHKAVSRYSSVTSQGSIQIQFCYATRQYPDTVLLRHKAVSRYSSVTSQGSIQIQFCYVTRQYPDTVLLHHRAIFRYSSWCSSVISQLKKITLSQATKHELCDLVPSPPSSPSFLLSNVSVET